MSIGKAFSGQRGVPKGVVAADGGAVGGTPGWGVKAGDDVDRGMDRPTTGDGDAPERDDPTAGDETQVTESESEEGQCYSLTPMPMPLVTSRHEVINCFGKFNPYWP